MKVDELYERIFCKLVVLCLVCWCDAVVGPNSRKVVIAKYIVCVKVVEERVRMQ